MVRYRFLIGADDRSQGDGPHSTADKVMRWGGLVLALCIIPFMLVVALPILLVVFLLGLLGVGVFMYRMRRLRSLLMSRAQIMEEALKQSSRGYSENARGGSVVEGEVERRVIRPEDGSNVSGSP